MSFFCVTISYKFMQKKNNDSGGGGGGEKPEQRFLTAMRKITEILHCIPIGKKHVWPRRKDTMMQEYGKELSPYYHLLWISPLHRIPRKESRVRYWSSGPWTPKRTKQHVITTPHATLWSSNNKLVIFSNCANRSCSCMDIVQKHAKKKGLEKIFCSIVFRFYFYVASSFPV